MDFSAFSCEGGSIGNSDTGHGFLNNLRLSQTFVQAGNPGYQILLYKLER